MVLMSYGYTKIATRKGGVKRKNMSNLELYLNTNYPKNSKTWYLMQIAFLNDYHRTCFNKTLFELNKYDKERSIELYMNKLCDAAMNSVLNWIRIFDKDLANLRKNKTDFNFMVNYFEVKDVVKAEDNFSDLVHGEGYSERVRNQIKTIIETKTT